GAVDETSIATSSAAREVRVWSMASLLRQLPGNARSVVIKMDIEGAEQQVLCGDTAWLHQVQALIAEFHPTMADYPLLIQVLHNAGFRSVHVGPVGITVIDFFERDAPLGLKPDDLSN